MQQGEQNGRCERGGDEDRLTGRPLVYTRSFGPGVDKSSQPVEAVEDNTPEDQLLNGRTEEYDDQDYRRYGYVRALLYPANEPFHKRLLDRRLRRIAEPFEDEDAERGYDQTKEEGSDADGHSGADSRQKSAPGS